MTLQTRTVALADLELDDDINARRHRTDEGIEELKASIRAHGLVQALRVRPTGATGKFKIVAGSRRCRVLSELCTDGDSAAGVQVTPEFPVPVIVGDDDDQTARELSQAENFIRLPQHEADTYETFRELADRGLDEAQIAARFGIDVKRVRRMLALGRLSPMILGAWRDGSLDERGRAFETVRAFTLAPTREDQERVFTRLVKDRNLHSGAVLAAFGGNDHNAAKHIKIAGLEAYRAAGGQVTQDLFGDNHIIADKALAQRVAEEKITATLAGLKAEGWAWVSLASDLPYSWHYSWSKLKPGDGKPTADEKKQIKKLQKAVAKGTDGAADELATLQKAVVDRQWNADQLKTAGAVLEIGHHGDLTVTRGVVKPGADKKAAAKTEGPTEKVAPTISQAMVHRLSIQATMAMRTALGQEPRLGLIALLAALAAKRSMYDTGRDRPVRVLHEGLGWQKENENGASFENAFKAIREAADDEELFRIAAGIAGRAVDLQHTSFQKGGGALAAAIDADRMNAALREAFDAVDYFNGVAKPFVIQAIREAVNEDEARKAEKLKKKELVEFAAANVPQTGWLPPELRCATYSGPGEVPKPSEAPPLDPDLDAIEDKELDEVA
jgi:ParB family chromosome partitioning protein